MSKSRFEIAVETYQKSKELLVEEFGGSFEEKVLNHQIRRNSDNPREIACFIADYINYVGEEVKMTEIIEPALWAAAVHLKITRTVIDGNWAYGYYKNELVGYKYFLTNVVAKVEEKYTRIKVENHARKFFTKYSTQHSAEVTCNFVPNIADVAIACGYHPAGYGCYNGRVEKIGEKRYSASWTAGNSCD